MNNEIMQFYPTNLLKRVVFLLLVMGVTISLGLETASAQDDRVTLEIHLAPEVADAQELGLTNLGVSRTGEGAKIVTMVFRNNTGNPIEDLYFGIDISSGQRGVLVDLDQEQGNGFTLDPYEVIVTNNNSLQDGIPQIPDIRFEDDPLTSQGEDLINSLEGSTKLPADTYQVTVSIYQGANGRNGGEVMAKEMVSLGGRTTGGGLEIYLLTPGGTQGSGATYQSQYPEFNWDGSNQIQYRLLVVEENEDYGTAEALLQGAKSTEPVLKDGRPAAGSLMSYENLDVSISNSTSFQFPSYGVQPLQQGKTYFWQVIGLLRTPSGSKEIPSDIWSFKLTTSGSASQNGVQLSSRQQQGIKALIGEEKFNRLKKDGYDLQVIQYQGQQFQSSAAGNVLNAFQKRVENGEIEIISRQ